MKYPDLSTPAQADLAQLHAYIALDSTAEADKFLAKLFRTFDTIAVTAGMGRARPELGHMVRSFPVGDYLIFYRPESYGVLIVRVLHGARDIGPAEIPDIL